MTMLERPITALLPDVRTLLVVPVLAGLALGAGDLFVMTHVAYPWADLANSSAVWAVGAFALGAMLRTDPARAAVAGVVMLLVAVESYYAYAAVVDLAGYSSLWSPTAQMWLVFAVLAGGAFGTAGAWTSGTVWWQRVLGAAAGSGVLIGEALHTWLNVEHALGPFHRELVQTGFAMVVLGGATLLVTTRSARVLVPAALLTLPFALFCSAAFTAVGIAY